MKANYNEDMSRLRAWIRTRSGVAMTMVFSDVRFSFNGNWKQVDLTEKQLLMVKQQSSLLEMTTENPAQKLKVAKVINKKVPLQGLKFNKDEVTLVIGDMSDIQLGVVPTDYDISNYKLEIFADQVKTASCESKNMTVTITAHSEGQTYIRASIGSMTTATKVTVVAIPKFIQEEFLVKVGEEVKLSANCPVDKIRLTVPENVSVVEGTTVKAEKAGTYDIIASAYDRTLATKLVVSEETTETPTE